MYFAAIDDNVMNMLGYDPDTQAVFGLARDGTSCLRTKDAGHSWLVLQAIVSQFAHLSLYH